MDLVRATCLYVATKLGDMMDDLLIIGGLVPSLIVDQVDLPDGIDAHVGTMDLDVGLQLALLDEGRYRKLTERLRDAGFEMDKNDDGNPTRQRWAITNSGTVTVDFLIPPSREGDRAASSAISSQTLLRSSRQAFDARSVIESRSYWRGGLSSARRRHAQSGSAMRVHM